MGRCVPFLKEKEEKTQEQAVAQCLGMWREHIGVNNMKLQILTQNVKPITRKDTMEGEDYLVVPMVMITQGVHNGSHGAFYYPPEELEKTPVVWNHKPVVVYHPDGSACDPATLTARKIGVIMNTTYKDGKLKAEAWLNEKRVKKVDGRIIDAIENEEMLEVSTGVFVDEEKSEGVWNGEDYAIIARNYRPDHLAVLPDKTGACSIEDGAGFLRLNEKQKVGKRKDNIMNKEKMADALIANEATKWTEHDKEALAAMDEGVLEKMTPVVNEEEDKPEATETPVETEAAVANEGPEKPETVEEYISNAPPEMQEVLKNGVSAHKAEKQRLVNKIAANKASTYSEDELQAKQLDDLQKLAKLATPVNHEGIGTDNYSGNGEPPIGNSEEEPLGLPAMDFSG